MAAGTFGAMAAGSALPLFSILFGDMMDGLGTQTGKTMMDTLSPIALNFTIVGIAAGFCSYLEVGMWMLTAGRQARKLKAQFLAKVMAQEIAYFDTETSSGSLLDSLAADSAAIQDGLGEKMGNSIHHICAFVASFIVAFIYSWDMTLVMLATVPVMAGMMAMLGSSLTKGKAKAEEVYAAAGGQALATFSGIRTVQSFNAEDKLVKDFMTKLNTTIPSAKSANFWGGLAMGGMQFNMFCSYGLAMWYGGMKVRDGKMTGGDVMVVLFTTLIGGFELGQAGPKIQAIMQALVAGGRMFKIMDRKSQIDATSDAGTVPASVSGTIRFEGVHFAYPARPDIKIFDDFNLEIPAGQSIALVGESGSGKSTVVSLIERFYDPLAGKVSLDGEDVAGLQVRWLRDQIGLVSQEPTLFALSIKENIKYGKEGATDAEVEAAAKAANAHNFISALPDGYDTQVGERGIQLSGGQKQRVAIARAMLKDPKILLLDEATSALDAESEKVVQEALDNAMVGRTTVIVAHRLSTVRNANAIAVLQKGKVVEMGTHDELIAKDGAYAALVRLQNQDKGKDMKSESTLSLTALDDSGPAQEAEKGGAEKAVAVDEKEAAKLAAEEKKKNMKLLYELSAPEMMYYIPGCIAAAGNGAVMPMFALALAEILDVFYVADPKQAEREQNLWALVFVFVGTASLIFESIQYACFGTMGLKLSLRFRELLYKTILNQDIGFFDLEENASGVLAARLATDAAAIRGAVADVAGVAASNMTTMLFAFLVAFIASWKMSLILTATLPLLGMAGYLQNLSITGFGANQDQVFKDSNKLASEVISNMRTVASFNLNAQVSRTYQGLMDIPKPQLTKQAHLAGFGFGLFLTIMFWIYGFGFWVGGKLIDGGHLNFGDLLKVFFGIVFGTMGAANVQLEFPDVEKAGEAVERCFKIVNRPTQIDASSLEGAVPKSVTGTIRFEGVHFAYPSRPNITIFQDFNLEIPAGQSIALVGESGSGKSTIIALVERFYDPLAGKVSLDGEDVAGLQVRWLRDQIGLVSQEPTLFALSIKENIKYGKEGATDAEVEAAAKAANAHNFISALPDGYDTQVGERGIQLSGGQKQRVAIARAMLKDPKILLLDEATSALDAESEKVVQEALDNAMVGRTTVIVAHRLSTVRNANAIAVLQKGKMVEMGTHDELIAKGGAYADLVKTQMQ